MDERAWVASTDPKAMLEYLSGRASGRKLRLYAAACARRASHLLRAACSRQEIEVAERYADGRATPEELAAAGAASLAVAEETGRDVGWEAGFAAASAAYWSVAPECVEDVAYASSCAAEGACGPPERAHQVVTLHCIFGNPFRPLPLIDPAWLTWNEGTVRGLAEAAYEHRVMPAGTLDNARLDILADALEEAGCDSDETLCHLRQQGAVHYRGCWVLDLLLNKE